MSSRLISFLASSISRQIQSSRAQKISTGWASGYTIILEKKASTYFPKFPWHSVPEEKIGLAKSLFSFCVHRDYSWDSKGPLSPTVTQSGHHCGKSIPVGNRYSLGLWIAAFLGEGSCWASGHWTTGRHVVQNLAGRWTGDSEGSEETVLEQGTQTHQLTQRTNQRAHRGGSPPALFKSFPNLALLVRSKSLLLLDSYTTDCCPLPVLRLLEKPVTCVFLLWEVRTATCWPSLALQRQGTLWFTLYDLHGRDRVNWK